jgi:DNA-binding CsgD family transcriptional regulator
MVNSCIPPWVRLIAAPVWVTSDDFRICWLNSRAKRLLGNSAGECVGARCYARVGATDINGRRLCRPDCEVQRLAKQGLQLPVRSVWIGGSKRQEVNLLTVPVRMGQAGTLSIVHCVMNPDQVSPNRDETADTGARTPLSPRELEVLEHLVSGAKLKLICRDLGISYATLRNHVQHILGKLHVHSIREAVARATGTTPRDTAPNSARAQRHRNSQSSAPNRRRRRQRGRERRIAPWT